MTSDAGIMNHTDHEPHHSHIALDKEVVFRGDRDPSGVKSKVRVDDTGDPHHDDRDQQDLRPLDLFQFHADKRKEIHSTHLLSFW